MEILALLLNGFAIAFEPLNLALIIGGCAIGLFIGAMPGLGSVNGVAILLPMTFLVPPTGAIIFLGAIYYGAIPAFLIFYLRFMGNHSWRLTGTFAVVTPVITFLFFEIALQKTLPKGFTDPWFEPIFAFFY